MPSAWNNFVKQFYEEKHKMDPNYKFKQALSDAAPVWKSKNHGMGAMPATMPSKKGSKKASSRKSKKASKSKKSSKRKRSSGRKTRRH